MAGYQMRRAGRLRASVEGARSWVRQKVLVEQPGGHSQEPAETEDPRNGIAKVLAGGFSVVVAGLGAIGVKDGSLDRILRNEPLPAIFVFAFIAAAVGCGVIAPALSRRAIVRGWTVPAALILSLAMLALVLPNFGAVPRWTRLEAAAACVLVAALALILIAPTISQKSALIALGLGFFAIGLYGTFKLAVESKSAKDRVRVSASVVTVDWIPGSSRRV